MRSQRSIPSLDGLRAISILMVIVSHLAVNVYHDRAASFTRIESITQSLFLVGHLGVTVFFVISGFLITTLLLQEEPISLRRFYFRRTLRIFPPFYFYLAVILALGLAGLVSVDWSNTIAAFTYTRNYFFNDGATDAWYLAHTWSLCVEEQFYLIFPATLVLLGKRWGFGVVGLVLLACPVVRLIYVVGDPSISIEFGRFETVADSLAIGCLLAKGRPRLHSLGAYKRLIGSNLPLLAPAIAIFVTWLGNFPKYYSKPLYVLFLLSVQNLCIAIFLDWAVTNAESRIGKLLNLRPVVFLGVISYSVYLWQEPFLAPQLSLPYAVKLILVFAAAIFSYYVIERPSFRLRKYLEGRNKPHIDLPAITAENKPETV